MTFETIDQVFTISFDIVGSVMLAAILLLLGYWLRGKIKFLERFCIPAPVVGGFLMMLLNCIFYATGKISVVFDTTFQDPFMLAFFTTVGLGASISLLKKGGKQVIIYWLICGAVAFIQCCIGAGASIALGMDPAYGLVAGPAALIGGHGGAAAYGKTIEAMGHSSGVIVGMAAATYGLIVGGLIGGPAGRRLIIKYNLKPTEETEVVSDLSNVNNESAKTLTYNVIIKNITVILICMTFGTMICKGISYIIGMSIPNYVGAMFLAVIIRNVNAKVNFYEFDFGLVDKIGEVFLGLFLSMALMSLKLWELAGLAGPLLIVLIIQTIVLLLITYFVVFRLMGKDYDAAVMCAGLLGHGLGATPTAIVNMSVLNEKFGFSRKAMMIVPIVGAFLVDLFYQPCMVWFISMFA